MGYYMTFDLGGSAIKYGVINDDAEIVEKGMVKTSQEDIKALTDTISDITKNFEKKYRFNGIALSAPGAVDDFNGIIKGASAIPCIHGPKIKDLITEKTSLKVAMENDANCAALAEVWKGVARNSKDVLFVVCGTGIGGAVIKDRILHTGANLHGGEFGYMILDSDLEDVKIWSEVASTGALARKACEIKRLEVGSLEGKDVFEFAEAGDESCKQAIDIFYTKLALGIYNLQYIYDPEMIILGGAISGRQDIVDRVNEKIRIILEKVKIANVVPKVERCEFFNDANLLGAVYNFKVKNN